MLDLMNIIWFSHPLALTLMLNDRDNGEDTEPAAGELLAALLLDDTFNEYSEEELTAVINDILNDL